MTIEHNTDTTLAALAALTKHLVPLFTSKVTFEVLPASEHDGCRPGYAIEPVAAIQIDGRYDLYPMKGVHKTFTGTVPMTFWAIDKLVDASDPSVGMFGCEPEEHSLHDNLGGAICEIAKLITEDLVAASMGAEAEDAYAHEIEESERAFEESMDGDFDSAMASAGLGTDEDYGYDGDGEDF